jgi:hypothetical protein
MIGGIFFANNFARVVAGVNSAIIAPSIQAENAVGTPASPWFS